MPCKLCGSIGANMTTCPLNQQAVTINPVKHYMAKICDKTTKFVQYTNFITDISAMDESTSTLTYQGAQYNYTKDFVADGAYGAIYVIKFNNHEFVIKQPKDDALLEEVLVLLDYAKVMQCENVIPMKMIDGMVIMPYISGDMSDFKMQLTAKQADGIVRIVRDNLDCLARKGVYYMDNKAANVLYNCSQSGFKVLLGDMGSIIPDQDELYAATHPYPVETYQFAPGWHSIDVAAKHHAKIYDYQMALMYFLLRSGYVDTPYYEDNESDVRRILSDTVACYDNINAKTDQKYISVLKKVISELKE